MNRKRITKINYLLISKEESVLGKRHLQIFISNLINDGNYEVTSRNTRDFL